MGDLLTDEERSALKESIQDSGRSRERAPVREPDPTPVALIADDQATEKVRPVALRIAERWAAHLRRVIPPASGAKVEIEVESKVGNGTAELLEEIAECWIGMVRPGHGRGSVLMIASGPMLSQLSAHLLGSLAGVADDQSPTAATLRVFAKVGHQLVTALIQAMEQEQGGHPRTLKPPQTIETWQPLVDESPLISVRLAVSGEAEGTLRMVAPPDALAVLRTTSSALQRDPLRVRAALAEVPVELSVELGSTTMRASEFARLKPGEVLSLDSLVGDRLPVRVAGRLHGSGHAVLIGDVIAVKIAHPNHNTSSREESA